MNAIIDIEIISRNTIYAQFFYVLLDRTNRSYSYNFSYKHE